MLILSGAPDLVVSWSDFSLYKKVRKLIRICRTIFSSFYRIYHFNEMLVLLDAGPLWLLSYDQQSWAYFNVCYLLWSHAEYRIIFSIYINSFYVCIEFGDN